MSAASPFARNPCPAWNPDCDSGRLASALAGTSLFRTLLAKIVAANERRVMSDVGPMVMIVASLSLNHWDGWMDGSLTTSPASNGHIEVIESLGSVS